MHERLATNEERRVKAAFGRLSSLADTLGLPERVRGRAQQIYHDAVTKSKRLVRGKLNVTAAAAVFAACRVERVARSVKEVAAAATLKKHHVMQRFSALKRELELDVTTVTASDFIVRAAGGCCCVRAVCPRHCTDSPVPLCRILLRFPCAGPAVQQVALAHAAAEGGRERREGVSARHTITEPATGDHRRMCHVPGV